MSKLTESLDALEEVGKTGNEGGNMQTLKYLVVAGIFFLLGAYVSLFICGNYFNQPENKKTPSVDEGVFQLNARNRFLAPSVSATEKRLSLVDNRAVTFLV